MAILSKLQACLAEDGKRKRYYLVYTILFLICAFFCFSWFLLSDRSLIWNSDGWLQHFKALVYYAKYLRSIIRNLLNDHKLVIPNYDFNISEGSDILRVMHYYVIGDPITLLAVFVPTRYMQYFYSASCILRLYLAGIAFSMLCFGTGRKNRYAILTGALSYAFCMWGLYNAARHPFFLNPLICFPLLILGIEKILHNESALLFIFAAALSAISNFYFFYIIAMVAILYALIRLICLYKKEIGKVFSALIRLGVYALIGVSIAAVILLPVMMMFLEDSRMSTSQPFHFFYPLSYYGLLPGAVVSNLNSYWFVLGLTAPVVLSVFLLFSERKKHGLIKALFAACAVITVFPICGRFLNGMSYMTNRWVWALALLCAYTLVLEWESLLSLTRKKWIQLTIACFIYYLICLHFDKSRSSAVFSGITLLFVSLAILREEKADFRNLLLIGIAMLSVINTALWEFSPGAGNYVSKCVENSEVWSKWKNNEGTIIKKISESAYTRYSGRSPSTNACISSGISDTTYYWSISNPYVVRYRMDLQIGEKRNYTYKGYTDRTTLMSLAAVQYYAIPEEEEKPKGIPYGYELIDRFKAGHYYLIYKNNYELPLGYCYDTWIPLQTWEKMDPVQKQQSMLDAAVVEEDCEKLPQFTGFPEDYLVPYEIEWEGNDISRNGTGFISTKNNAKITIVFEQPIKNEEIYIGFEGLEFKATPEYDLYFGDESVDPLNLYSKTNWDKLSQNRKTAIRTERFHWNPIVNVDLQLMSSNGIERTLEYIQPDAAFSSGMHDYVVNIGYVEEETSGVTITFPIRGIYSLDKLCVYHVPMDGYEEKIEKLRSVSLTDLHLETDTLYGNIDADATKILCIAIPYSKGWNGYIDGTKTEVFCVNDHYLGMIVPKGKHEISLHYSTPYRKIGLAVSAIGLAASIAVWLLERRKKKQNHLQAS